MFVLIWATLLFTETGASVKANPTCENNKPCITQSEGYITAEAGLCVVLPCSFTGYLSIKWYKCNPEGKSDKPIFSFDKSEKVQSEFAGRVTPLDSYLRKKNCSIVIKNLTKSDSGSYHAVTDTRDACKSNSKATVSVTDLSQKPTVTIPLTMMAGEQTTLTCTAPGPCYGSRPKFTWVLKKAGENETFIFGNITDSNTKNQFFVRHNSTLTLNPSAELHGSEVTCKVSISANTMTQETKILNVTYVKQLKISGKKTLKNGDALNLTCSVDSFPASSITWTKSGSNKNLNEGNGKETQVGSAFLIIPNVTEQHSGQYICTAKHLTNTIRGEVNVTVKDFPRILRSSGCEVQSEVLTCVCTSEGFPVPTIKWPLLESCADYSVTTTVSNTTVSSTITVSLRDHPNATVECVSSNDKGETKENLKITAKNLRQEDLTTKFLSAVKQLQVIIALLIGFLIGVFVSATVVCLARKCRRKKWKRSKCLAERWEMETTKAVALMDGGQAAEHDGIHDVEGAVGGAESAEPSAPDGDVGPKEVEYSDINFSGIPRKNPADEVQNTVETEYAEIKTEERVETQDNVGEDGEMLEGGEEKVVMIGEDEETQQCVPAEVEGGEDVALYSNVSEIMGEN